VCFKRCNIGGPYLHCLASTRYQNSYAKGIVIVGIEDSLLRSYAISLLAKSLSERYSPLLLANMLLSFLNS